MAASIFYYLGASKACYVILALCSDQQGQECVSMIVHTTDLPIQKKITLYYNLYCQCSKVIRSNSRVQNHRCLGTIFILRKVIGVGGWSRKWQFSLMLCSEMSLRRWVGGSKKPQKPLRNIKMAPKLRPYLWVSSDQTF